MSIQNQTTIFANGASLDAAMQAAGLEVKALEIRSNVSHQTIRNYLKSSHQAPHKCRLREVDQLAKALKCDVQSLILGATASNTTQCYYDFACQSGVADSTSQRFPNLAGKWTVRVDLDAAFNESRPWSLECVVEFQQNTNTLGPGPSVWFSADVEQNDVKSRWVFDGCLTEDGNVLCGCYQFFEDSKNPKHGHIIAICFVDEIRGQFIGRNRKNGYGIVYGSFHGALLKNGVAVTNTLAVKSGAATDVNIECSKPEDSRSPKSK